MYCLRFWKFDSGPWIDFVGVRPPAPIFFRDIDSFSEACEFAREWIEGDPGHRQPVGVFEQDAGHPWKELVVFQGTRHPFYKWAREYGVEVHEYPFPALVVVV